MTVEELDRFADGEWRDRSARLDRCLDFLGKTIVREDEFVVVGEDPVALDLLVEQTCVS